MKQIRIGGVPEHFNYPWHYAIANNYFDKKNIVVHWIDVKGGSGAMTKMLQNGELDMALVLTEGIIKHIHAGGKSRIVQQFVKSPLVWGVHSSKVFHGNQNDLSKARIARSRIGSGSHLMAYVHAEQNNYHLTEDSFVTVGNIDGAIESFENNESDILLWEKTMTQPYVDEQKVNRIGQCISPWPCFMLVAGEKMQLETQRLNTISDIILHSCEEITHNPETIVKIANLYHLDIDEVTIWYTTVEWQTSKWISRKMLQNVVSTLDRVNILGAPPMAIEQLCMADVKLY